MKHETQRVSIERLAGAIEELLQDGPRIVDDIVEAVHYSGAAVRIRLGQLMKEGRVHRRRIACDNNPALFYRWHAGPPEHAASEEGRGLDDADLPPVQVTVHTYPKVDRRDPLVAALFGIRRPAGAEARAVN